MARFDAKLPKSSGCFGYKGEMGLSDFGVEKAGLTPTKNKFSWMEMSQGEAMRAVKGKGTSSQAGKDTESSSVRRMYETD